jgi:KDO2-lipid IV(A) lauroyltransferase
VSGLSNWVGYATLSGFFALCRLLPPRGAHRLGRALGDLLYDVIRIRREVAFSNLRAAFPEKSEGERERIARACYRNFAMTAVDFARQTNRSSEDLLEEAEILGRQHLDTVASMGRGAILLTGHFGNWEWMGSLFPAMGFQTQAVVGEQRNRLVEELMDRVRRTRGLGILSAERDLRGLMEALRRGDVVAIAGDQDAGRDGVFIDFLGRPASTAVGPVRLARRFGVPILIGFAVRRPDGGLRLELQEPLVVPQDGDESEVILEYSRRWSAVLEEYVRRYPDQWFWMHRRWKTQPEGVRQRKEGRE